VEFNGIKIWGSPVQPCYKNWAFNRNRGSEIKKHWDKIPSHIDILITHGPSYSKLDRTIDGLNVGCKDLLDRVNCLRPKYHIFGHIHESYGCEKDISTGVISINASLVNKEKILKNSPIAFAIADRNLLAKKRIVSKKIRTAELAR
jgi:Icc-related predicted phosphoesterase